MELIAVLTNKCQQGAYRGFGSEVTNWMLERMADAAADELKMDPIELRRKNLIQPDQFPYVIPSGNLYDSGNYPAVLEEALRIADLPKWQKIRDEARAQGRCVGHRRGDLPGAQRLQRDRVLVAQRHREPGLHAHQLAGVDARIRIDPTGAIHVTLGSPFWGNSPETMATRESSPSSSRSIRRRSTSSTRTPRAASTPPARAAAASR